MYTNLYKFGVELKDYLMTKGYFVQTFSSDSKILDFQEIQ